MKILIADKFEQGGIDQLTAIGCETVCLADLTAESLPAAVAEHNPDVLVVRSTRVNMDVFKTASKLNLIIRAGAGYDTIDVAAASANGVFVCNCPGKNSIAVAELTMGLILCCDRRIPDQTADLRNGTWKKKEYAKAAGLMGRTIGIIGFGGIGQEVAKRAKAFGMRCLVYSHHFTPDDAEEAGVDLAASPLEIAEKSDIVTIHVPADDETQHMVNDEFIDAMRPGAFLINTSRGSIVDEHALRRGIREKSLRAGLDVFADEPASGDNSFSDSIINEPGVYGTHHVGASTTQSQQAIAAETVRIIDQFRKSGRPLNCINLAKSSPAAYLLTLRLLNEPGVLAHVFYMLGQKKVNVEEMENVIYDGAKAACAQIHLDEAPDEELITAICSSPHVVSATVSSI